MIRLNKIENLKSLKSQILSLYGLLNLLKYKVVRCIDMKKLELVINYLGYNYELPYYIELVNSFFHYYYLTQTQIDEIQLGIKKDRSLFKYQVVIDTLRLQIKTAINIIDISYGINI